MSDDPFELLEAKVRKAAELVRRLRAENGRLSEERGRLEARLGEAEARLRAAEEGLEEGRKAAAGARDAERLGAEVTSLRKEREEVRRRIGKMLEVLESLD